MNSTLIFGSVLLISLTRTGDNYPSSCEWYLVGMRSEWMWRVTVSLREALGSPGVAISSHYER